MAAGSRVSHMSAQDLEAWQLRLDSRFPRVDMLRPDQVAKGLGVDDRTVARLFAPDDRENRQWLMGIEFSSGDGKRMARRIPRECAILFFAHSANFKPDDFLELLLDVVDNLHPRERLLLQQRLAQLQARK